MNERPEAKVLLLTLSRRTSAKGREYMSGWLGKASVVAFQGEPDKFGNETWEVFVATPQPCGDGTAAGDRAAGAGRGFFYTDGACAPAREGSR